MPHAGRESAPNTSVREAMLLGALVLALLNPVPAPPAPKAPVDARAECLKTCAGAPKDATGKALLACLRRCEPADAGVAVP